MYHFNSRSYKPSLVQAYGFIIVTEKIHEEFDAFVATLPLLSQGSYLQCDPLLQYWSMHTRPTTAYVLNLFAKDYLNLHYSDKDNLCEWVTNARGEYENHAQPAEEAVEQHEEPEFVSSVTNSTSSTSMSEKLWIAFGEVQLYEADRYSLLKINE